MNESKKSVKRTEKHKKNISKSRRGMKFTESHKRNMRQAKAKRNDFMVVIPQGWYTSFAEAGRQTGISYKTIFNRCKNPNPRWKDWRIAYRKDLPSRDSHRNAVRKKMDEMSRMLEEI